MLCFINLILNVCPVTFHLKIIKSCTWFFCHFTNYFCFLSFNKNRLIKANGSKFLIHNTKASRFPKRLTSFSYFNISCFPSDAVVCFIGQSECSYFDLLNDVYFIFVPAVTEVSTMRPTCLCFWKKCYSQQFDHCRQKISQFVFKLPCCCF